MVTRIAAAIPNATRRDRRLPKRRLPSTCRFVLRLYEESHLVASTMRLVTLRKTVAFLSSPRGHRKGAGCLVMAATFSRDGRGRHTDDEHPAMKILQQTESFVPLQQEDPHRYTNSNTKSDASKDLISPQPLASMAVHLSVNRLLACRCGKGVAFTFNLRAGLSRCFCERCGSAAAACDRLAKAH